MDGNSDSALNVLAINLRGFGEMAVDVRKLRKSLHNLNDHHLPAQTSLYIEQTPICQVVQNAIDVLGYLNSNPVTNTSNIELVGVGQCRPTALHETAINFSTTSYKAIDSTTS